MALTPKTVFLIDGIGAVITAVLLGQVLARFESFFGMPKDVLWILSGIAFVFAIYSISCHLLIRQNFRAFLLTIIIANTLYCLLTASLILIYFNSLTWFGVAYFIGEIMIIVVLVKEELKTRNLYS